MKYIFILLVSTLLYSQENTLDVVSWNYDVINYKAILDISDKEDLKLDASCTITFDVLDLTKNESFQFGLAGISLESVTLNGVALTGNLENLNTTYFLKDISGYLKSQGNELVVKYQGKMTSESQTGSSWGGVFYKDSILYAMGVGFHATYVSTTRHWLACFDHPQDKATFDLIFIANSTDYVASIGNLAKTWIENGKSYFNWKTDIPTATYLVTFANGPLTFTSIANEPVPQGVYHLSKEKANVEKVFYRVPEMIAYYSSLFGEYPFEKLAYVISEKGAMEHQTLINYPRSSLNSNAINKDTIGSVIAHELAHQWFGDKVTCESFSDAWLNESFASFCESLWLENIGGEEQYWKDVRAKADEYLTQIVNQEKVMPLYDFPRAAPSSNYPATIYQKGAVVLSLLRFKVGGDIFFSALKKYLNLYGFSNANTEKLKALLEQESKMDLDDFFNQWVYGLGWPVVQYNITKDGDDVYLEYNQIQDQIWQTFTNVPFEVSFNYSDGGKGRDFHQIEQKMGKILLGKNIDASSIKFNNNNFYSMVRFVNVTDVKPARDNDFIVFPNPAVIDFIIDSETKVRTKIKILDAIGNIVYEDELDKGAIKLSTNDFTNGLYIVFFESSNGKFIEKLIINK